MKKKTYRKIKPSEMTIDRRYQADLNEYRVERIAKSFDPSRLGVIIVSIRPNGETVVIDGQHRVFALGELNLNHEPVMCEVHEGLTLEDEAYLFWKQVERRTPNALSQWKARIVASDPIALEIVAIGKSLGLRIGGNDTAPNNVRAIRATEAVHSHGNLKLVLYILKCWGKNKADSATFDGTLIRTMGHFLQLYPGVDVETFIKRLSQKQPGDVLSTIKNNSGRSNPIMTSAVFVYRELYNARNRKKLPMPEAA